MKDVRYWIDALGLEPLPEEGGWYREVYRAAESIPAGDAHGTHRFAAT